MATVDNGTARWTEEERQQLFEQFMRETDGGQLSGFVESSKSPYLGDWEVDFTWDECPDSVNIPVASATLVVGKPDKKFGRIKASSLRYLQVDGLDKDSRNPNQVNATLGKIREAMYGHERVREWSNYPDPFGYGANPSIPGMGGVLSQYVPPWPGPVTRQLYWQDYWMMSSKAFEAYNHDPISWRCVHMKSEFALGKGIQCRVTKSRGTSKGQGHDSAQKHFDEFWKRNGMDDRLDKFARDLCWAGEQMFRYFPDQRKKLLTVRSMDPASVYDLITDPEDHETVFAYHQQFQTPYQLYPPKSGTPPTGIPAPTGVTQPNTATRYIIRQIKPQEVDHYKVNSSAYERRGRSDLFPALGWIKRLRDYLTSHVIQADMLSRICWDLEVQGNVSAISSLRAQLFPGGQPPQPGTVFGHSAQAKLTPIAPQGHSGGGTRSGDPILDALVTMTADAAGLPKDWLGFGTATTRANALVSTEPAARSLEYLQSLIERVIQAGFERDMKVAGITDANLEVTFPSIATEDRKGKLDDLGTMEGNQWISKRTAASIAAKEMGISNYDYDTEQDLIAQEFPEEEMEDDPDGVVDPLTGKKPQRPKQGDGVIRRTMILATKRQQPKLDVTKSPGSTEDEAPGVLVPTGNGNGVPPSGQPPPPRTGPPTRSGLPSTDQPLSAQGAKDIRDRESRTKEAEEKLFSVTDVIALVREMAKSRRSPDDPAFKALIETYRSESEANLKQLEETERP